MSRRALALLNRHTDLEVAAPACFLTSTQATHKMMNRAGSRLKPIAPRPTADSFSPTSTVSAVSLDPKDYVYPHADYVWGVPQAVHPSVVQQQHAYMSPCVASNPGMYGTYGSVMSPWGQSAMPQYHSPMAPASAGGAAQLHPNFKQACLGQFSAPNGVLFALASYQNMLSSQGSVLMRTAAQDIPRRHLKIKYRLGICLKCQREMSI